MLKFKVNYNKKGILALEALIGTILSIIALFFIFQIFASAFLQTPNNLKIAEQNAKSIVNFVDFSENKYNKLNIISDCFNMLKIVNIENFQTENENEKYIYIIDNKGVYLFDYELLAEINNKKEVDYSKQIKFFKFKEDINLKIDKTEEVSFSFEIYFFNVGGNNDNQIKFEEQEGNFILLVPKFKKSQDLNNLFSYFNFLDSNQNNLMGFTQFIYKLSEDELKIQKQFQDRSNVEKYAENYGVELSKEELDYSKVEKFSENIGNYLVYNPQKNILFLSKSQLSNTLIKTNLCSQIEFQKYAENKVVENLKNYNPEKLDYINYKIEFSCIIDEKPILGQFIWDLKPICIDTQNIGMCNQLDQHVLNNIKYLDFLNKLKGNCYNILIHDDAKFEIKEVKLKEIYTNNRGDNLEIFDIFKKIKTQNTISEIKNNNNLNLNLFQHEDFIFTLNHCYYNNNYIDPDPDCNYVYLYNDEIYFFYIDGKDIENYKFKDLMNYMYKIDIDKLKKINKVNNKDVIIFNGKEINLENKSYDSFNNEFLRFKSDNKNIYCGDINLNGYKSICLSEKQYNSIKKA